MGLLEGRTNLMSTLISANQAEGSVEVEMGEDLCLPREASPAAMSTSPLTLRDTVVIKFSMSCSSFFIFSFADFRVLSSFFILQRINYTLEGDSLKSHI